MNRKSPIQRLVRKVSQEDIRAVSFKVTMCSVPTLMKVRDHIYPVVKPWSWIKKARETLQNAEPKSMLLAKQLSGLSLGVTYGVCSNEDKVRYISSQDLEWWQVKEKDVVKLSKENLTKKIGLLEKQGSSLFIETQTGIYYSNQLKHFTASLLAMPEVFNMVQFSTQQSYNHVVLCPTPQVLFVTHSQDTRGLCMIAEICLRVARRENPMHSKPIRVLKAGVSAYEASMVRNESHWPTSEEQIKTYKKSIIKRSRKQSLARFSDSAG